MTETFVIWEISVSKECCFQRCIRSGNTFFLEIDTCLYFAVLNAFPQRVFKSIQEKDTDLYQQNYKPKIAKH